MQSQVAKAYEILDKYNGLNNQINYYKSLLRSKNLILSEFDSSYIIRNYDYEPQIVNKIVKISSELGNKLQEKYLLDFIPEKIHISRIIGEMGGSYHCYVQYRKSVEHQLMYISKKHILTKLFDVNYMDLDIDFDYFDNLPSAQGRKLKEHQKTAAKFLVANKKCILADSMGLGKSVSSIIGALAGGYKNILIITTASLKSGWKKDLLFYEEEENINIVNGSTWTPGSKFTLINYDIITNFYEVPMEPVYTYEEVLNKDGEVVERMKVPVMVIDKKTGKSTPKMQRSRKKADIQKSLQNSPLFLQNYDCVIIDEAQKLSNKGSNRYTAISDFLTKSQPKAIFLLTGTPLTNNPINLYNILKLIDADVTHDYRYYMKRYCGGIEHTKRDGSKFWTYDGVMYLDELREKIKDVYIRRLASETGEMVDKVISRRYYDLTLNQESEYKRLWEEYQKAQEEEKQEETEQYRQLVEGMLIRQYLAKEMTEHTIKLTDELLEDGEKVVIMTNFQEEMEILANYYGKRCVTYNGKMSTKQKDKAQDEFMNNKKVQVFIGQIVASGVGLSLPVSRKLIFNSFSWSAADNKQAEDRVYRLTQTEDVEIIYQLFNNTWAQQMFDKVLYKDYLSNQIIKSEINK